MIGTLILLGLGALAAASIIEAMYDWAESFIKAVVDVIVGALYYIKQSVGAIFKAYRQRRNGEWEEVTRKVSESEIPEELLEYSINQKVQVARWS